MARYENMPVGVYDNEAELHVLPGDPAWPAYLDWLAAGNVPDPYTPPPEPEETLAEAKLRRIAELKREGVGRIQTRFPAVLTFDTLKLVRELLLSINAAARSPTVDMQWLIDTWIAGENAAAAVDASTTIPQVDSVTATWPAL